MIRRHRQLAATLATSLAFLTAATTGLSQRPAKAADEITSRFEGATEGVSASAADVSLMQADDQIAPPLDADSTGGFGNPDTGTTASAVDGDQDRTRCDDLAKRRTAQVTGFAGYVADKFFWCSQTRLGVYQLRNGVVVGRISWTQVTFAVPSTGNVPDARSVLVGWAIKDIDFSRSGTFGSPANVRFRFETVCDYAETCQRFSGTSSGDMTFAQWKNSASQRYVRFAVPEKYVSDPATGQHNNTGALLYTKVALTSSNVGTMNWSTPLVDRTAVQCDSSKYPSLRAYGCGFSDAVPIYVIRRSGIFPHIAQHIYDAQHGLSNPAKQAGVRAPGGLPGFKVNSQELTRLYFGTPRTSVFFPDRMRVYDANRDAASDYCDTLQPVSGADCDEYPFASTWEGSRPLSSADTVPRTAYAWSARYIEAGENRAAGSDLANFYRQWRILNKDGFRVSTPQ